MLHRHVQDEPVDTASPGVAGVTLPSPSTLTRQLSSNASGCRQLNKLSTIKIEKATAESWVAASEYLKASWCGGWPPVWPCKSHCRHAGMDTTPRRSPMHEIRASRLEAVGVTDTGSPNAQLAISCSLWDARMMAPAPKPCLTRASHVEMMQPSVIPLYRSMCVIEMRGDLRVRDQWPCKPCTIACPS